jgi:hypothetical protein
MGIGGKKAGRPIAGEDVEDEPEFACDSVGEGWRCVFLFFHSFLGSFGFYYAAALCV